MCVRGDACVPRVVGGHRLTQSHFAGHKSPESVAGTSHWLWLTSAAEDKIRLKVRADRCRHLCKSMFWPL